MNIMFMHEKYGDTDAVVEGYLVRDSSTELAKAQMEQDPTCHSSMIYRFFFEHNLSSIEFVDANDVKSKYWVEKE